MVTEVEVEHIISMPVSSRLRTTPPSSSQYSTSSSESPITTPTFRISFRYDGGSSDDGAVTKIEELDDSIDDGKSKTSLEDNVELSTNGVEQRRTRGRPRKPQVRVPDNATNQPRGRVKTGCITCRKRKKKCDEAKPICMRNNHPWSSMKDTDTVKVYIARRTITFARDTCRKSIGGVEGKGLSKVWVAIGDRWKAVAFWRRTGSKTKYLDQKLWASGLISGCRNGIRPILPRSLQL